MSLKEKVLTAGAAKSPVVKMAFVDVFGWAQANVRLVRIEGVVCGVRRVVEIYCIAGRVVPFNFGHGFQRAKPT